MQYFSGNPCLKDTSLGEITTTQKTLPSSVLAANSEIRRMEETLEVM